MYSGRSPYATILWPCPEDIRIGGGVTFPVIIDKTDGDEPYVISWVVIAINAFGIETVLLLAYKVIQVLRHVGLQVVFLRLLRLMIPVGVSQTCLQR